MAQQTVETTDNLEQGRQKINSNFSEVYDANFTTLTDGGIVTWDTGSKKLPSAKLTSTQSFDLNMTNVITASRGVLKLITGTASAITITFDTDFTNKRLGTSGDESFATYTFPTGTGKEYLLEYVAEGTVIHWTISVTTGNTDNRPSLLLSRTAIQSVDTATLTALAWDTIVDDNSVGYSSGSPTRIPVPGTGDKIALITTIAQFPTSATGIRRIRITKNGSFVSFADGGLQITHPSSGSTNTTDLCLSGMYWCSGGDYIEIQVQHGIGSTQSITGNVSVLFFDR